MNTYDWPTTRVTLINGLQAGENPTGSWNDFVSIYGPVVMRICLEHKVQDPDASDIAQEVFVRVYKGISDFEYTPTNGRRFGSWVGKITRNEILRFVEQSQHRVERETEVAIKPRSEVDREFAAKWDLEERFAFTVLAINALRAQCDLLTWQLFEDRVVNGLKPAEVAEKHNVPVEQVYRTSYRIGNRIAELVNEMLHDDVPAEKFS